MRRSSAPTPPASNLAAVFLIAWAVVAGAASARAASLEVDGFSNATNDPQVQDLVNESGAAGPIAGGASSAGSATVGSGATSGTVSGSADYGVLRVRASGTASGPFLDVGGGVAGGSIEASWTDRFTIVPANPSLNFQPGTFTFVILLDGTLSADAGGAMQSNTRAQFGLNVDAGTCTSGCDFRLFGEHGDFGSQGGGVIDTGDQIANFTSPPVPFLFGVSVGLSVALQAFAQAVSGAEPVVSSADADLGTSLLWGGLVSVADGSGSPVTAYTVTSESGVDWSQPIPEPATGACLAAGLAALAAGARRHRR